MAFEQITNFRFEVSVHDDSSTDYTSDIIREYSNKCPDTIKPNFQQKMNIPQELR